MKLVPLTLKEAEAELLDTGLLYLINRLALHPLGLAIAFSYDDPNSPANSLLLLRTDDGGPLVFDDETTAAGLRKLRKWVKTSKGRSFAVGRLLALVLEN